MPDALQLVPAAQYLRMSREHQRYSIRNQARAIAAYATQHGFRIVRTYTDPGRSGLTLRERPGLRSLLADAIDRDRAFRAVLVLDVSRWGRFQNLDQSAHYEFLCCEVGVPVVYCAEAFQNDGSPVMALMKQVKRLMAAEYSRELSGKVLRAQLLQAKLGYKQGGSRRYGFQRVLLDETGREVLRLERGQSKALSFQRVVHGLGPEHELAVIREIFRWYTSERLSMARIVERLNARGTPSTDGGIWTGNRVRSVLKNELVVGDYVFNRTSCRLKGERRTNPPEVWIKTRVVEPIISQTVFDLARRRRLIRRHGISPEEALASVARLHRSKGFLTGKLIDECAYTPSTHRVTDLLGDLRQVYELVGYAPQGWWHPKGQERPASPEQLLKLLRELHEREGYVSEKLITADPSVPSASIYQRHFGSLTRAYELAGLPHNRTELQRLGHQRERSRQRGEETPRHSGTRWPTLPSRFTDGQMLDCLRRLRKEHGYVSADVIRRDEGSPTPMLYVRRFGSLLTAYEQAGLTHTRRDIWSRAARARLAAKAG